MKMTCGNVVDSLIDYAKDFILEYRNSNVPQDVIDAIVVDYVNYFAAMKCCADLAMYTEDLRAGEKRGYDCIDKSLILPSHNYWRDKYAESGIIKSVNRNSHMNKCGGKAKCSEREAIKIVNAFIDFYMKDAYMQAK